MVARQLVLVSLWVALCAPLTVLAQAPGESTDKAVRERATKLASQLGDAEFKVRERATTELIQLGPDAIPAIETAARRGTSEVRKRSQLILKILREVAFDQQLTAFEQNGGEDAGATYDLPGWRSYRQLVGDDPAARSLFVSMLKRERDIMRAVENTNRQLAGTLQQRTAYLSRSTRFFGKEVPLGTVASLLFLASNADVRISVPNDLIWLMCRQSNFTRAVAEEEPTREPLLKLMAAWIAREDTDGAYYPLLTGMRYDIKECVDRARHVLRQEGSSATDTGYASLAIARYGGEEDFEVLERLTGDERLFAQAQVGNGLVVTQVRDVGLVSLIRLSGKEPKDFGFNRLQPNRETVYTISSIGFATNDERVAAIAKWREQR